MVLGAYRPGKEELGKEEATRCFPTNFCGEGNKTLQRGIAKKMVGTKEMVLVVYFIESPVPIALGRTNGVHCTALQKRLKMERKLFIEN